MLLPTGLLAAFLAASAAPPPAREAFDPARDPQRDVWAAMDVARAQHKRILLDVGGEWCGWCHLLDRTLASNRDLSEFVPAHFVVVKVNFSVENQNKAFLSCYPSHMDYPHLFILDRNGNFLHSQGTDAFESGDGYDPGLLLRFFQRWSE
jgi:thioredoxin-related protein